MAAVAVSAVPVFNIAGHKVDVTCPALPDSIDIKHFVPIEIKPYEALRKAGQNFDATVNVGDKRIKAHKELLKARIPFFRGNFESDMKESALGEVNIAQFDAGTVSSLIDYAYTGLLKIDEENVNDLMVTSSFLSIESVMNECAQFIRKRIHVNNALGVEQLYRANGYHKLDDVVFRFIDKNIVPISFTPEFVHLSVDEVEGILHRSSLNVDEETQVLDAVTRWLGGAADREQHAARLLRTVRCTRIPEDKLTEAIEKTPWVVGSSECLALIEEAMSYHKHKTAVKSFSTEERRCDEAHSLIFAVGMLECTQSPKDSPVAFYDPIMDKWTQCAIMPSIRGRNGVAVIGRKIYAIGGYDGQERLATCDVYDADTNTWSQAPELITKRAAMGCGVIDGKIYVAGGFDGSAPLKSVEMFNPEDAGPEWSTVTPMNELRGAPASCVFNGKLYVIGGHNGQEIFKDGEVFDPETNVWTKIAPMKYKRMRFGAAVYHGQIYVVGGFNGAGFLRDVERYDPRTNTWTSLHDIRERRGRSCVAVSCGKLFTFGGFNGIENIRTVEMYQPETDLWVPRKEMPVHRGGVFVANLPIPASFASPVANLEADDVDHSYEKYEAVGDASIHEQVPPPAKKHRSVDTEDEEDEEPEL